MYIFLKFQVPHTKYFTVNPLKTRSFSYIDCNTFPPLNKFNIYIILVSNLRFIFNVLHCPNNF